MEWVLNKNINIHIRAKAPLICINNWKPIANCQISEKANNQGSKGNLKIAPENAFPITSLVLLNFNY